MKADRNKVTIRHIIHISHIQVSMYVTTRNNLICATQWHVKYTHTRNIDVHSFLVNWNNKNINHLERWLDWFYCTGCVLVRQDEM